MKQEAIDAQKIPFNPNIPTVLFVIRDNGGCGYYRCYQPASWLRRAGLFNTITDLNNTTPEHIKQADIVVFQEVGSLISIEAFNCAKEMGKLVLIECDDLLYAVSPNNPGYECWNPATLYLYRTYQQLGKADGMIVSTPQLAREFFPYNKNIYVVPNFLSRDKWTLPQNKKIDNYQRIGWAGGNAHKDDLRMVSSAIEKIIQENKDKVKLETMGLLKEELTGIFKLEEFHDICPKCDYQGDTMTYTGETLDNYPLVLANYGWDVAIAPIINTAFNCAKSDLKLKEYSAIGYPIVASAVTPYIEAKKDGCDVLLAETHEEWYNSIKELLNNEGRRKEMVENNKIWVARYWIEENVKIYADIFNQILNKTKK
jgi:O-antigen biosynthesis protein